MEIRKVQLSGGSSYVLTLPKEWISKHNIKKNYALGLIPQDDGTLIVTPKTSPEKIYKKKKIIIDDIKSSEYLFRLLIGSYISGFSTIKVISRKGLKPFMRDSVNSFTRKVIGTEIIEEDIKYITIKDLLDPSEMPFSKTMNRMSIIARTMHIDAIKTLKKREKSIAEEVDRRDREVNKLHWLVSRQFNLVLNDATLCKKMSVTQEEATFYYLVSRLLERIGDHAVKIANNICKIIDEKIDQEIIDAISAASEVSLEILTKSVKSWNKRDIKSANATIDYTEESQSYFEKINDIAIKFKGKIGIALSYISESIRRTGEYSANICENIINHLTKEEESQLSQ